jgi:hypothetical protein
VNVIGVGAGAVWGIASTQLFLQCALAFVSALYNLWGLALGEVKRSINFIGVLSNLLFAALWGGLLVVGELILTKVLGFGYSDAEAIAFGIAVLFSALFFSMQLPERLVHAWKGATIEGYWESRIIERRWKSMMAGHEDAE